MASIFKINFAVIKMDLFIAKPWDPSADSGQMDFQRAIWDRHSSTKAAATQVATHGDSMLLPPAPLRMQIRVRPGASTSACSAHLQLLHSIRI
ncbi:hypothetical protein U9M48_014234 [Paspalum notatum var. saurae]|uniref:Uncharacterized protein n=1 Tax=Paspalum notatum var. saurae TaxID=547442 RepID=A0AAQ3T298_PASNO